MNDPKINLRNPAALGAFLRGDLENAIAASTPGGILAQEAAGQQMLIESQALLPKKINNHDVSREQISAATGIVFGEDHDDLFVKVTLPRGWKLIATSHSMNSELVDAGGGVRAYVFYKAAFYDRSANIHFSCRYTEHCNYAEPTSTVSVYDRKTKRDVWTVGTFQSGSYHQQNELTDKALAWLDENYHDYRNPFAYWDQQ